MAKQASKRILKNDVSGWLIENKKEFLIIPIQFDW
jgi:hypothetical protein